MSRHVCDCGQVYASVIALEACAGSAHIASLGNELADAEREARLVAPDEGPDDWPCVHGRDGWEMDCPYCNPPLP